MTALVAVAVVLFVIAGSGVHLPSWSPSIGGGEAVPSFVDSGVQPGQDTSGAVGEQARRDGVDVGDVMDTVSHRVVAGPSGTLVSDDDRYRASFDAAGFELGLRDGTGAAGGGAAGGGGVRVSTTEIAVGPQPVATTTGPWEATSNVAERSLGSGIVERVTATDGQVEWDVVLGSRLPGTGDLRISADVSGAPVAPRPGDDGLRWDLGDGRSIVMGALIVKDRTGAELHRAMPEVDGSGVTLTVPASVLRDAAYPLVVDPTVSPAFPVSDPVPGTPAEGIQHEPAIAFDGTNYLVVWEDYRTGGASIPSTIYGTRVSPGGAVLDPVGLRLSTSNAAQLQPAVAFDGTNYLVTWDDRRVGGNLVIYGTRVSTAGAVLDLDGIEISNPVASNHDSAIAFDGTNYLVVWTGPLNNDLVGARVSTAGTVLDGDPITFVSNVGVLPEPQVGFDGTNYLIVWGESNGTDTDVVGVRVSTAGVPLGEFVISAALNDQYWPALAFDGTNYLVTWVDQRTEGNGGGDIYGARVDTAGTVLDPAGIPISTAVRGQSAPSVAFDGTNYLVTWSDGRRPIAASDVFGARVSPSGSVLDPSGIVIHESSPELENHAQGVLGFDGTNFLAVWHVSGDIHVGGDIEGIRVTPTGSVIGAPVPVATAANAQITPAVAFDGTNYLVVWTDARSGTTDIYGARVSGSGTLLDGTGIAISAAPKFQRDPAVAFDGTNFLVTWEDGRSVGSSGPADIYGARVSQAGAVLDAAGIPIATGGFFDDPDLAFDGTNYLVVWEDFDRWWEDEDAVVGVRVSTAGSILDGAPIVISAATGSDGPPSVAFDGTNHLVTFISESDSIVGVRVSGAGTLVGNAIPVSGGVTNNFANVATPVAFDGTNYLVVWNVRESEDINLYGARVSPAGTVLDPADLPISTGPGRPTQPDVAANGSFLVVWREELDGTGNIVGTRVNGAGQVLDGAGFPIATAPTAEQNPAVVAGPGNRFGVVYQRFAPEAPYGVQRTFLRNVSPK